MLMVEHIEKIAVIPIAQIAYVDECGIDTYFFREYGWSERGSARFNFIRMINTTKTIGLIMTSLLKRRLYMASLAMVSIKECC